MFNSFELMFICIPFIAAFIGWLTNWGAVKALLYPINFIGIPPIFGWQGVLPKNAEQMSQSFGRLIREQLIDVEAFFADLKGSNNQELEDLVDKVSKQVIEEFATNIAPENWAKAREKLREYITKLIRKNVREVIDSIMESLGREADQLIDIDRITTDAMVEDRALLGEVLNGIADKEFKFIEKSGLYFGFIFGLIQMVVWTLYPKFWVLPAAGFFVGYITNWLAMNLIFEPREEKVIGPFRIQGVFLKRQQEVAVKFADVICDRVLNVENLIKHIEQGAGKEKMQKVIEAQIEKSMRAYEKDTMVAMLVTPEKLKEAKAGLLKRISDADMSQEGPIKSFLNQSDRMKEQITNNLRALDSGEFAGVLRPVFQKDEWKLLLAGGVIGTGIGFLQYLYLFSA